MNRSITWVGVVIILAGIALTAFPIVVTGAEQLDLEQEAGLLLAPIGLLVVLIGAVQPNPERTTIRGTFGNPDENFLRHSAAGAAERPRPVLRLNPREAVECRHCRTVISFDLAQCPRCARSRDCRVCGRPLEMMGDRTDCPSCHRVEAFCNCPRLERPNGPAAVGARPRRG